MNFQPLLESAQPITVHAMAAMLAVGLGGVQFVLPKGSRLHRWLGYARAVRAARQGLVCRHLRAMIMLYVFWLLLAGVFTFLPGRMMHIMLTG